eukprot:augustus_masked-scaffold_14-processed-gene-6.1-mRNA-1 protein AED:1.00 eAED:1.00 QI:0/-1/0/0/-1/1/1/0/83
MPSSKPTLSSLTSNKLFEIECADIIGLNDEHYKCISSEVALLYRGRGFVEYKTCTGGCPCELEVLIVLGSSADACSAEAYTEE